MHIALLQDFGETVHLGDANLARSIVGLNLNNLKGCGRHAQSEGECERRGVEPSCYRNISAHVHPTQNLLVLELGPHCI